MKSRMGRRRSPSFTAPVTWATWKNGSIADFGMKCDGEQWLEAWNLRLPGQKDVKAAPQPVGK